MIKQKDGDPRRSYRNSRPALIDYTRVAGPLKSLTHKHSHPDPIPPYPQ